MRWHVPGLLIMTTLGDHETTGRAPQRGGNGKFVSMPAPVPQMWGLPENCEETEPASACRNAVSPQQPRGGGAGSHLRPYQGGRRGVSLQFSGESGILELLFWTLNY